jgi:hypothetical protein
VVFVLKSAEAPAGATPDVLVQRLAQIAQDIAAGQAANAEAEAEEARAAAAHAAGSDDQAVASRASGKPGRRRHGIPVAKADAEPLPRAGLDVPALECFWKCRLATLVKEACISLQSRELVEADLAAQNPSLNPSGMLLMGFKLPLEQALALPSAVAQPDVPAAAHAQCATMSHGAAAHAASADPLLEQLQADMQAPPVTRQVAQLQAEQQQQSGQVLMENQPAQQELTPQEAQPGWHLGLRSAQQERDAVLAAADQIEHAATLAEALQLARIAAHEARWRRWQLQPHQQHRWQEIQQQEQQQQQQQQQMSPKVAEARQQVLNFHAVGLQLGFEMDQARRQHHQAALGAALDESIFLNQEEKDRLQESLQQLLQHTPQPAGYRLVSQHQDWDRQQAQGRQHQVQTEQAAACSDGGVLHPPWAVPELAQAVAVGSGMLVMPEQQAGNADHHQQLVLQQLPAGGLQPEQHTGSVGALLPSAAPGHPASRQALPALEAGQQPCVSQLVITTEHPGQAADDVRAPPDLADMTQSRGPQGADSSSCLAGVAATGWHAPVPACTSHTLQQHIQPLQGGLAAAAADKPQMAQSASAAAQAAAAAAAADGTAVAGAQFCPVAPFATSSGALQEYPTAAMSHLHHHQQQQQEASALELPITNISSAVNMSLAGEAPALPVATAQLAGSVETCQRDVGMSTEGPSLAMTLLPLAPAAALHHFAEPACAAAECSTAVEGALAMEQSRVATALVAAEGAAAGVGPAGACGAGVTNSQSGTRQLPAAAACGALLLPASDGPLVAAADGFMHLGQVNQLNQCSQPVSQCKPLTTFSPLQMRNWCILLSLHHSRAA